MVLLMVTVTARPSPTHLIGFDDPRAPGTGQAAWVQYFAHLQSLGRAAPERDFLVRINLGQFLGQFLNCFTLAGDG